jgi:hypothetical protein
MAPTGSTSACCRLRSRKSGGKHRIAAAKRAAGGARRHRSAGLDPSAQPSARRAAVGTGRETPDPNREEEQVPDHDLEALWAEHCRHEFETRDVDATMATMVPDPYVNHVESMQNRGGQVAGSPLR